MMRETSRTLLTDLYQLTMAAGYWQSGRAEWEATFHLYYRRNPFGGGYAVACGLEAVIELLRDFRFTGDDLAYLHSLRGNDGRRLFDVAFLAYLGQMRLRCEVDAIPEGTVVFPDLPLLRIQGPLVQCQILETALLTVLNFQTLIATKAARITQAAGGDPVLEFGLRRAQGLDGGLSASRAAYVGGCAATSNLLAGSRYGIPVKGTHAHSWVMAFEREAEAFAAYAAAQPNNCIFLVDTYDTLAGLDNAIVAGLQLREEGHEMVGIRLDSGDLAALSKEARLRLDAAGFPAASIVASGDLDEHEIVRLKTAGARIDTWGVGTRLATADGQPALGGVYKLSALRPPEGAWRRVVKLSEEEAKTSNPGILQARRFADSEGFCFDVLYDEEIGIAEPCAWVDGGEERTVPTGMSHQDLLVPVARDGRVVYGSPPLAAVRERTAEQLARLPAAVRQWDEPASYPVGLECEVHRIKRELITGRRQEP